MNRTRNSLLRRYAAALAAHLQPGAPAELVTAQTIGARAMAAGVSTLELAKLHEQTLVTRVLPAAPPRGRSVLVRQAGDFFAAAIAPIRRGGRTGEARLLAAVKLLSRHAVALAASNHACQEEIRRRQAVEAALRASDHRYQQLLGQSDRMQEQMRDLSRRILSAQEDERKEISRELHDVIAQTLTGINVRLATLKREAGASSRDLDRNIARTQRLVEKSVDIVHRFARELRPAVLDDLGLIPALHAFMNGITRRTGMRISLTACAAVEQLGMPLRTVLFRVAQEALTNVSRHAQASQVEVGIVQDAGWIHMTIHDDGRSFAVERVLHARGRKRLGLLGMRERLEMVGGRFAIASARGQGTTITACLPAIAPAKVKP